VSPNKEKPKSVAETERAFLLQRAEETIRSSAATISKTHAMIERSKQLIVMIKKLASSNFR